MNAWMPSGPLHHGAPGWASAPVPGWGQNPLLAGPRIVGGTHGLGATEQRVRPGDVVNAIVRAYDESKGCTPLSLAERIAIGRSTGKTRMEEIPECKQGLAVKPPRKTPEQAALMRAIASQLNKVAVKGLVPVSSVLPILRTAAAAKGGDLVAPYIARLGGASSQREGMDVEGPSAPLPMPEVEKPFPWLLVGGGLAAAAAAVGGFLYLRSRRA